MSRPLLCADPHFLFPPPLLSTAAYFGEFGYELALWVPYTHYLHSLGLLALTAGVAGSRALHPYSPRHWEVASVGRRYAPGPPAHSGEVGRAVRFQVGRWSALRWLVLIPHPSTTSALWGLRVCMPSSVEREEEGEWIRFIPPFLLGIGSHVFLGSLWEWVSRCHLGATCTAQHPGHTCSPARTAHMQPKVFSCIK